MKPIIFSGHTNEKFAKFVAKELGVALGRIDIEHFEDGETYVNIQEDIKGKDVFVVQSCSTPTNENFVGLLIMLDAAKRLKPKRLTAVMPFMAYRRQIEKTEKGEAITSALVAKLVEAAGADRVIVVDLHDPVIKSFFTVPFIEVSAFPLIVKACKRHDLSNSIVVAPDKGALGKAKQLARALGLGVGHVKKTRGLHDVVAKVDITKNVSGKDVFIIDDEVNTAGTLVKVAELLKERGAQTIRFACTHPVLSGNAIHRIEKAPIEELMVGDTIYLPKEKRVPKITQYTIAPLVAQVIAGKKKKRADADLEITTFH